MRADDYIAVPFSPKELVARLHALRKRIFQFTPESLYIFDDVMGTSRKWRSFAAT